MSWNIEQITELATGFWQSSALAAAVQLRLFDAIEPKGSDAEMVAAKVGSSARHTGELLDALAALGILEKFTSEAGAGVYRIRPSAAQFLTSAGQYCILDALEFNADLYPLWARLPDSVRNGKPALPPGAHLGGDPARTLRFVRGMHSRALAMIPAVIPSLETANCTKLLDVASGPGTFSCALAEMNPALQVTLFDLPPVLAAAKELIAGRDVAPRVSFQGGDYHTDALPEGFDAVLYCGALHQESPESAAGVFAKIFRALQPRGRLYVVDMMLRKDRTEPVFSALFSLNMMLTSPSGRVFTDEETRRLAAEAGFINVRCVRLANCPYWLIAAEKPAR